jgi:hypothetical protein
MNTKWVSALLLAFSVITGPALAQGDDPLASQALKGALVATPRLVSATIVGIEPATRTLTLRGAKGNVVPVVVKKEVTNFDTLKIGDRVDVMMKSALLLKAVKVSGKDDGLRKRVDTEVYAPASDGSGYGTVHQVEILATVQRIDKKNKTITLRGAQRTGSFTLSPAIAAQNLKVGDTVHAVYISAMAVEVTPKQQ